MNSVVEDVMPDLATSEEIPVACKEDCASIRLGDIIGDEVHNLFLLGDGPLGHNVYVNDGDGRAIGGKTTKSQDTTRNNHMRMKASRKQVVEGWADQHSNTSRSRLVTEARACMNISEFRTISIRISRVAMCFVKTNYTMRSA